MSNDRGIIDNPLAPLVTALDKYREDAKRLDWLETHYTTISKSCGVVFLFKREVSTSLALTYVMPLTMLGGNFLD